ncbi:FMN-dependent NADH-azoreductase [Kaistia dalseonensis]|uniref:FMN dependent NADH:quinone oxidoreductase n=1 Tax=Kaistia dalseonensis TaxID=410840 RepID=A0ABU0H1T6_9HYPH|nr:FMN-dependent NADH-azoreductase [Kaistia dalseonensis]MCX5493443.1 FMN-dependent NADH-azoreductase [Kaistia dalseonensis]MDQ0436002.1 FMN-dependent NADH-azoreductase [Kaistia dalseonensis]
MTNILFVTSSPRGAASHSTKVAEQVLAGLIEREPGASVVRRDLSANPLPHLGEDYLGALFSAPEGWTEEQRALVGISDTLVDEVFAADVIVIASAMINFSVPSTLKTWLDYVARAGKTFSYGEAGPKGLITGKRVVLVESKGGIYSEGPMKAHDHQLPYLRFILAFLGMTDVEVIQVEGVNLGPDIAVAAVEKATTQAGATAKAISDQRQAA